MARQQIDYQVFNNIQPVIILARFLGLCPINYKQFGNKFVIYKSRNWAIFGYIQIIIITSLTIWGVFNDLTNNPKRSIKMSNLLNSVVNILDIIGIIIVMLVNVVLAPFQLKFFFDMFDKITNIDKEMAANKSGNSRKSCILTIITITTLYIALAIYDMIGWLDFNYDNLNKLTFYCRYYITAYILGLMGIQQEVYIWYLMNLLKTRMKLLNNWLELKRIQLQKAEDLRFITFVKSKKPWKFSSLTKPDVLKLSRIHQSLCELLDCLNNLRGIPTLTIVSTCFLSLIITPYFLLMELNEGNFKFTLLQLVWFFAYIIRLMAIIEPCHCCIRENEKVLNKVFNLLQFNLDDDIKRELKVLIQQIVYRISDFSSCGFFTLNHSLLTAVAGSVMTYLIILVQFSE